MPYALPGDEAIGMQELVSLQRLLAACRDEAQADGLRRRLSNLELRRILMLERRLGRHVPREYRSKLAGLG